MKRFLAAAALLLMSLSFADRLSAGNFGIIGGANFQTASMKQAGTDTMTKWHAGLTYKLNLPLGFHFQPSLLYNVKGAEFNLAKTDLSVGYLELMASVQWGIDLILFRPFIDVSPFVGYGVSSFGDLKDIWNKDGNRLECGAGVGGGLDIWRFQIVARYNWNFGKLMALDSTADVLKNADFGGVTLSLAYFF